MKYFKYLLLYIISAWVVTVFSFWFGHYIGTGENELYLILAVILLLNTTLIVGIFMFIDILKNINL